MAAELTSLAEKRAEEGEELRAFSGLKLLHVKREVSTVLGLIGREGIFDEYTSHDISHVDEMLKILEWLIPPDTQSIMSPSDWLMIVLAVYFHDLGMLVSKAEYGRRAQSGFKRFCDEELFAGTEGEDYRARLRKEYPEAADRERFLYQEFVRAKHPQRIREWISGDVSSDLGVAKEVAEAVNDLLSSLDAKFRQDLALVCESHHLNDLQDTEKYPTSQPYGNTAAETANVQYASLLLRSADLLNITRDRTPSIVFRIINPADPVSQVEWAKQLAVRSVRPKPPRVIEGDKIQAEIADTVEVHARFTNAEGFFGLTSYLAYANQQLRRSHDWAAQSNKAEASAHNFPWRRIDDSKVEASGFLPRAFAFEIDQARILDLLTGHTLYNDTGVVLRELVQNAMDAVRLQNHIEEQVREQGPADLVQVHWDSAKRVLSVRDNGTGMTQDLVEKHFLKVGSSRYQDPDFRKAYPNFSAISRFGIGVLSCFMIADDVDLVTVHPDEGHARHISLRSIHGKYLIRLLSKNSSEAQRIGSHGTEIRLALRPSASIGDVVDVANNWIVVPGCRVEAIIDANAPVRIGFSSPKEALIHTLTSSGYSPQTSEQLANTSLSAQSIKIVERSLGAVTMAYALVWSPAFKEWSFLDLGQRLRRSSSETDEFSAGLGTCIEGIRVERGSPGYGAVSIAAIANATGSAAPKTNVARSSIEATPESARLLTDIYRIYSSHLRDEVGSLHKERGFSLTWAAQEASFLAGALVGRTGSARPSNPSLLMDELGKLPSLIAEADGKRTAMSPERLHGEATFWTSDSELFRSAENLIREAPGSPSLTSITNAFGASDFKMPTGILLSSGVRTDELTYLAYRGREVQKIVVFRDQRRVDLLWGNLTNPSTWTSVPRDMMHSASRVLRDTMERYSSFGMSSADDILLGRSPIETEGLVNEIAVRARGQTFLIHGNPVADYLLSVVTRSASSTDAEEHAFAVAALALVDRTIGDLTPPDDEEVHDYFTRIHPRFANSKETSKLIHAIRSSSWGVFDPWVWQRKPEPELLF